MTTETTTRTYLSRNETIKRIRTALRKRSGKLWSVTGGRGTTWGWIEIDSPPARRTWRHAPFGPGQEFAEIDTGEPGGHASPAERVELSALLGLEGIHHQGHKIPASNDYYQEYVDRAEGRAPSVVGRPYWD